MIKLRSTKASRRSKCLASPEERPRSPKVAQHLGMCHFILAHYQWTQCGAHEKTGAGREIIVECEPTGTSFQGKASLSSVLARRKGGRIAALSRSIMPERIDAAQVRGAATLECNPSWIEAAQL